MQPINSRKWSRDIRLTLCTFSKAFTPTANIKHSLHPTLYNGNQMKKLNQGNLLSQYIHLLIVKDLLRTIDILPCSLTCSAVSVSYLDFNLKSKWRLIIVQSDIFSPCIIKFLNTTIYWMENQTHTHTHL